MTLPNIIYGGCKECWICYGFNESTEYLSPAEYNPNKRTVYLRCETKRRISELPFILNHEVLHDIIYSLGEDTNIIDCLNFDVKRRLLNDF